MGTAISYTGDGSIVGYTSLYADESALAMAGAAVGRAFMAYTIVVLAIYVLYIIGAWKTFVRAGEPGWKAIIPLYNTYITYKICWQTSIFWIDLAVSIVYGITSSMGGFASVIAFLAVLTVLVLTIIRNYKLSKAFGHGVGFTIGLTFLIEIFMPILGLGSSQYIGPQE